MNVEGEKSGCYGGNIVKAELTCCKYAESTEFKSVGLVGEPVVVDEVKEGTYTEEDTTTMSEC